jgi:hydrophobic/amphiphilic exporter-1 (mainly G- bacteria), HAE1 family
MNIAEPFIRRPVMTTLVMSGLILFGISAYRNMPVSDLPNVDFPTIQVAASLPGASPETMASAVATPLERQFTTIAGLDSMTSVSGIGTTAVTLQFNLSRNLDAAALDVQSAIAVAQRQLPPMPFPPSYQKVNPADQPIIYIALTSPTLPLSQLDEYGETMMAERISTISGVAQVLVYGSQKYAVRVEVDPSALASRGIGIDEVMNAVANGNVNLPTGTLYGPHKAYTVNANGQLMNAEAYRPLIVAYRNGRPVRLNEIGRVIDSVENDKTAAWYIEQRSLVLAVQRQPGTNTVEVADAVKKLLPTMQLQLPASVSLRVLYDRSESIDESVTDVKGTLLLTLILVVLVIFVFLRNFSATVIPSLALPMSLVGTFIVTYLLGYSLDNLSLMALTLSVGFVVDDAIVMLENIVRHMEMGASVREAAFKGSAEIGFTILSMTISLAAVFIPVLFLGGIIGRLFHEFAVTIGAAILVSGFVSLSLTPMLCSRFLKPPAHGAKHGALYMAAEHGFDAILHIYERSLKWSLAHRRTILFISLLTLAGMVPLFMIIPKGFLPAEDTNQVFGFVEAQEGISFEALAEHQRQLNAVVAKDPNVKEFFSSAGTRGVGSANTGIIFMHLKRRSERPLSADGVIEELRPKIAQIPGLRVYLQNPPPIRIGGQLTKGLYQFTLQDPDTAELFKSAPELEKKMRALKGLRDVNTDLLIKNPQVDVNIDRDKAATLGITAAAIEDALSSAYGTRQISTIYAPNNEYQVILEVEPEFQRDPSQLGLLYVRSTSGSLVPMSSLAKLGPSLGPLSVSHTGQLPSVTLSFNLDPGVSIGDAVGEVQKLAHDTLPATVTTSFQGQAQAFQSSLQGLGLLLLLAVLVIYLVLGILYESFIHPITILSALPFAGFGALVTLLAFHTELSIYAFVGIIMLVGLVKKNGIMMVDFAIEAQKGNKSPTEAIYEACVVRFRPITMTTMAALMGTLPIALGLGAGAESRRPLGLAVVGGLLFSQLLTLFVTPVIYTYMDSFQRWAGRGRRSRPVLAAVAEPLAQAAK